MTSDTAYWQARADAVTRAIEDDPSVVMVGGYFSAPFNPPDGLLERHADRIVWPPISELAQCGIGVGAAMAGLRPLVPLNTSSFMFYGWPAVVNEAPNVRYLSGGHVSAPVVFHALTGARRSGGPQHEHTPHAMLQNVAGLHVYTPATPADVDGLLHAAFHGDDPVFIADHVLLAHVTGPVPERPDDRLGRADLLREGDDVLMVAYSLMTQRSLAAADVLADHGIRASVLNLRTIVPLPLDDVRRAVAGHPATVFVDEAHGPGSPAAHLMARVTEAAPGTRARLMCTRDAPSPCAPTLLDEVVPTVDRIATEAAELVGRALPQPPVSPAQ
jgi:pyruvate dehydrogenase E1 component beta subunit